MLLNFKTSVTYNFFSTSHRTTVSVVKQISSDIGYLLPDIVRCPVLIFRLAYGAKFKFSYSEKVL